LIEVDEYFGISLFRGMYDMNGNVFAAIPSLHCAFPIILLYFAAAKRLKGWFTFALIMMVSTWFAAVYTNHHYVIDVILGISTGILAVSIYHFIVRRTRIYDWLERYAQYVS
jgi:membrane-associated phospholipid phosphatase